MTRAALVPVLLAGIAVVGSNSLVLSPILSDVGVSLDAAPAEVARAMSAYGGGTALAALLLGPRLDGWGLRRVWALGLLALATALAASAAAPSWVGLAAAQAAAGAGAGVVLPATYALATGAAPAGKETVTLGRVLTGWSVSLVLGVPFAAVVADAAGWRAGFAILAAVAGAVAVAGRFLLPETPRAPGDGTRASTPWAALGVPGVPALLLLVFAYSVGFYAVYAFAGDHLRRLHGLSATGAGAFVLAYGLGFGAAALGDALVQRAAARRLLPLAFAAIAAAIAAMPAAAAASYAAFVAVAGLWGAVNHVALTLLVLLLSRAEPGRRGAIMGLNSAVTYAAVLLGTAAAGPLYAGAGFGAVAGGAAGLMAAGAALAARALRRPAAAALP